MKKGMTLAITMGLVITLYAQQGPSKMEKADLKIDKKEMKAAKEEEKEKKKASKEQNKEAKKAAKHEEKYYEKK